jgi:hypothetical protein
MGLAVLLATDNVYYRQRHKLITDRIVRSYRLIHSDWLFYVSHCHLACLSVTVTMTCHMGTE